MSTVTTASSTLAGHDHAALARSDTGVEREDRGTPERGADRAGHSAGEESAAGGPPGPGAAPQPADAEAGDEADEILRPSHGVSRHGAPTERDREEEVEHDDRDAADEPDVARRHRPAPGRLRQSAWRYSPWI